MFLEDIEVYKPDVVYFRPRKFSMTHFQDSKIYNGNDEHWERDCLHYCCGVLEIKADDLAGLANSLRYHYKGITLRELKDAIGDYIGIDGVAGVILTTSAENKDNAIPYLMALGFQSKGLSMNPITGNVITLWYISRIDYYA